MSNADSTIICASTECYNSWSRISNKSSSPLKANASTTNVAARSRSYLNVLRFVRDWGIGWGGGVLIFLRSAKCLRMLFFFITGVDVDKVSCAECSCLVFEFCVFSMNLTGGFRKLVRKILSFEVWFLKIFFSLETLFGLDNEILRVFAFVWISLLGRFSRLGDEMLPVIKLPVWSNFGTITDSILG